MPPRPQHPSMRFLPETYSLNLITKKLQTNPNCGTSRKMTGLHSSKVANHESHRQNEELLQTEGHDL